MQSGVARNFYDIVFWAIIAGLVYLNIGLYDTVYQTLQPVFQAYTQVVILILLVLLLLFVNYIRIAIAATATSSFMKVSGGSPLNYEKGDMQSNIQRTARRLEKRGEFTAAGETYETLEAWADAARAYELGNALTQAAAAHEKTGNTHRAIELYEAEGNFETAAKRCAYAGLQDRATKNYRQAAESCLKLNQFVKAAELFEQAQDYERAGQIFESSSKMDNALRCYQRAGNAQKVLELIGKVHPSELLRRGGDFPAVIQRSAELLASSGHKMEAAKLLQECHEPIRAAEIYESSAMWQEAAELYIKAEKYDRAEQVVSSMEDTKTAAELRANMALLKGDWPAAGKNFELAEKQNQAIDAYRRAKDYSAAARIYESMGRFIMAGEMYSSAKDLAAAAHAYAKAYDWRNAAECFEAVGDTAQALEAYANAGNYLKAGTLAFKSSAYAKAIEYLQRIPPSSPDYNLGSGFLAAAFFYHCREDMADKLFEQSAAANDLPFNRETLPIFYAYARHLEANDPQKALTLYRQILGIDINYSDVSQRIRLIDDPADEDPIAPQPPSSAPEYNTKLS